MRMRRNMKYRKRRIYSKQNGICNRCKCKLEEYQYCLDHIKPIFDNGSDEDENLQILCLECHLEKNKEENYGKKSKKERK